MSDASLLAPARRQAMAERLSQLLEGDPALAERFHAVRSFSARVRAAEYHLTNACNIRCKGCWFFEFGHDRRSAEVKDLDQWRAFIDGQRRKKVNAALLIGGEPTLFVDRIAAFVERMRYVSISTNGLKRLPHVPPFEQVTVFITLFGGGPLDDELRAIKPSGRPFSGLFDTALANYADDPRVCFVFAVTEDGLPHIEPTVRRIRDNGNTVTFNFYSRYQTDHPLRMRHQAPLLDEMLRVQRLYPQTVLNHPAHIEAMVTGRAWCGTFDRDSCPSISQDHPDNRQRLANGHPGLTFFNTWRADLQTLERCCTSGHCDGCRDSQAVYSWLIVSLARSLASRDTLRTWVEVAESYWRQFIWSPYRAAPQPEAQAGPAPEPQAMELPA